MSRRLLERIRDAIVRGEYDVTVHAVEEMAEDRLDILDVEAAIMSGELSKTETDDPRGARYTVIGGTASGKTRIAVVGRFKETGIFLIITAYQVTE